MRRFLIVLVTAVVGIGLLTALPGAASGRSRHRRDAAVVFNGQGNNLDAYESVPTVPPPTRDHDTRRRPQGSRHQRADLLLPRHAPRRTLVHRRRGHRPAEPAAGLGHLQPHAASRSASSGPREIGKLTPTYQGSSDNAENYGCGFLRDGRVLTTDVGNQAAGNGDGQLIVWFPPFDRTTVRYCKIDVGIATAGGIAVDAQDRVYVASARAPTVGVHRYTGPFPTSDTPSGGCDSHDAHRRADDHQGAERDLHPGDRTARHAERDRARAAWRLVRLERVQRRHRRVLRVRAPTGGRSSSRRPARPSAREPFSTGTPLGIGVDRRGDLFYADIGIVVTPGSIGPGDNTGTVRRIRFVDGRAPAARHHGERSRVPRRHRRLRTLTGVVARPVRARRRHGTPGRAPVESRPLWGDMRTCTASARRHPDGGCPRPRSARPGAARAGAARVAVCAPDEDPLTLAVAAAHRRARRGRARGRRRRRALVGLHPPAVRRGPEPRGAGRRALAEPTGRRRAHERLARTPAWRRCSARPTRSPPARSAPRSSSSPTASGPGSAPRSRPGPAPAPPRSCSRPRPARPRSPSASPGRSRCSTATAATASSTPATSTTPRLFREEMFLPPVLEVAEHLAALDPRAWSLPDPDGRLGTHRRPAGRRRPSCRRPTSTPRSATPRPRRRSSARSARSTRPAPSRSSAPAAAGPPAWCSPSTRRSRARPPPRTASPTRAGPRRTPALLRARGQLTPSGETIPMGVPPESALFARGAEEMVQLLGGRCADCGTINTPPSIHPTCIACGGVEARAGRRSPATAWCTRSSSTRRCRRRSSRRCRSRSSTSTTAHGVMLQVVGDGTGLEIGSEVDLVLRRYAHERGVAGLRVQVENCAVDARGRRRCLMAWNKVAVVGAGLIKMGELFDQSYEDMAAGAFNAAVASVDKGFDPKAVEAAFVATQRGTLWGQEGIGGNTVPTAIGLAGIPCTRIENACPSGSDAFRVGAMAVASGVHDLVLVIGVEKMRDKSTEEGLLSRAAAGHPIYTRGETAPVLFAPFATRHMHEFGTTREMLAVGGGEEPPQRRARPVRALPGRDHHRAGARRARGVLARCTSSTAARRPTAPPRCSSRRPTAPTSSPTGRCSSPASASPPTTRTCTRRRASSGCRPRSTRRSARTRWPASARPTSTWPRCTTASRSPRSSTSRTSASSRRARAASPRSTARRRSPAASRSTPRAGCSPRATRSAPPASRRSPSAGGSCARTPASARSRCATASRSSTTSAGAARA